MAGLLAADRFQISGTQLATFTVLQLLVYAALQVPVGVLLDRFGSKKLILTGLALMTGGQLLFAVVGSFELGIVARVLVGAGDAMIFVSVIRVVALWFGVRQSPLITQLTGQLGQVGAIAASFPLAAALHGVGWTPTFLAAALIGVVLAVLVVRSSCATRPARSTRTCACEPSGGRSGAPGTPRAPGSACGRTSPASSG